MTKESPITNKKRLSTALAPTTASRGKGGICAPGCVESVGSVSAKEIKNIERPKSDVDHRIRESGNQERRRTEREDDDEHDYESKAAGSAKHRTGDGSANSPYEYVSACGFKVNRVPRTLAYLMGMEIYDSQTRRRSTPQAARAKALDKQAYDQNYECAFADENLTLLTHELIGAAERDDVGVICDQNWSQAALAKMRSAREPLYAGFDVGRKVDLSVITVLEKIGGIHLVRGMLRMRDMRLPEQELRLGEICRLPMFRRAAIDMTGLGLGLFEHAQKQFGAWRIQGVNFGSTVPATRRQAEEGQKRETAQMTEVLAMELLRVYEERRIQHPEDELLREDLRKPEKVTTPGGRVSIAATRDEAGHADHFWSLALAVEAGARAGAAFAIESIKLRGKYEGIGL